MRLLRLFYTVPLRVRSLFRRRRVEQDLEDELRDHVERQTDANIFAGMTPDQARRMARRALGGIEQRKEECRDRRRVTFVEHRVQDLRFAVRQLSKHRGFASAAIGVLALGIGASVSIAGFVDAALIRPLPYQEPERLVAVFGTPTVLATADQRRGPVSLLDLLDWRARTRTLESIAAYDMRAGFTVSTPSGPQRVPGLRITSGFFRTLGVAPVLGREFMPADEQLSTPPAVMLSYSAWQNRFGGSPDVLGRTVTLQSPWLADAEPHVIVGVLPPGFHFAMAADAELWTTIRGPQACWSVRSCRSLEAIGRLAPSVSPHTAAAEMTSIVEQLRREYPEHHDTAEIARLVPLGDVILGQVRPILLTLLSGAGLLLLIACINVVSLLLARSDSRTREVAVRTALGASSARLVMQFTTEALLLAAIGGAAGLVLAGWGLQFLRGLLTIDMISRMPYLDDVGLNGRLIAFAAVISLLASVVFALAPILRVSRAETIAGLREGSRGAAGTSWRRLGAHLVMAELAVAVVLLVSAGLLGKSLYRWLHVDPGFAPQSLVAVSVTPVSVRSGTALAPAAGPPPNDFARQVADRVLALPGVAAVGYADLLPLSSGLAPMSRLWVIGRPDDRQVEGAGPVRRISAGYFDVLQAVMVRGRGFTQQEVASSRLVLVINETAARRYFPGEDPIGKKIAFGGASSPEREIVGVVRDIKDGPPETAPHPSAYVPFDQRGFGLIVRTTLPAHAVLPALTAAVRAVGPDALVDGQTTMTDRVNRLPSAALHRSTAWLVGGFAAMAFVLSVVGLYGVVSYSVSLRTREIGVRMALGAGRQSVYGLVLGETARLVAIGTTLGAIGAVTVASLLRHRLFAVEAWDAPTLVLSTAALMAAALVASYVPARRAARVNPVDVLRAE